MTMILPLAVGEQSTAAQLGADVGKTWLVNGVQYVLVKAASALTAPAGLFVLWDTTTAGSIGAAAGAAATKQTVAGLVPSTVSGNVAIGTYLLLIRKGVALAVYVGAATANTLVAVHAGPGLDDTTVTEPTAVAQTQVAVAGASTASCRVILD